MSDASSSDSTIGGGCPRIQISLRNGTSGSASGSGSGNSIEHAIHANPGLYKSVRKALKHQTLNFKINVECTSLKVSPSGNFLWGGFSDGTLRVWDLSGTFGVQDDDVVASRQKSGLLVNSKLTQGYGAVASQIHARGVHTDLLTTVDISDDAQYVFLGVSRGAMELHAVFVGDLERAVHTQKHKERLLRLQLQESDANGDVDFDVAVDVRVPPAQRNILDYLKVYCHTDAKLKGFGACASLRVRRVPPASSSNSNSNSNLPTSYLLLTGKGIKNLHIWKFTPPTHPVANCNANDATGFRRNRQQSICDPPEDDEDHGIWEQLYDTSTNGNTILLLGFYRNPQQKLLAVSKSDAQKLRLWDLSFEETEEGAAAGSESDDDDDSESPRPKRPPYQDVENSQQALDIAGGIGVCGGGNMYNEMSIVSLDRPKDPYNHTELALPSGTGSPHDPSAVGASAYSSRRQRRGQMKAVVNVATSQRDSSHALLELDDGSLVGYCAGSSSTIGSGDGLPKLAIATPESTGIPALPADFWRRCICLANISGVVIAASSLYNPNTNKGQLVIRALGGLKKPRGSEFAEQKRKKKQEQQRQHQQQLLQQQQHEQEERQRESQRQKEKEQLRLIKLQQKEKERLEQEQKEKERLNLLTLKQKEKERQEQLEREQKEKEQLKLLKLKQKEQQEQLEREQKEKERLRLLKLLQKEQQERQEQLEREQKEKERLWLLKLLQKEQQGRQEQLEREQKLIEQKEKERLKLVKLQQKQKKQQEQLEQDRKLKQQLELLKLQEKEKERQEQLEREQKLQQQKEKELLKRVKLQQKEKEQQEQLERETERLNLLKLQGKRERLERERDLQQQQQQQYYQLVAIPKTPSPIHTGSLDASPLAADKEALKDAVSAPNPTSESANRTNTGKNTTDTARTNPNQVSPQTTRPESTSTLTRVSPSAGLETPVHSNKTSSSNSEQGESPDSGWKMHKISHFLQPKRINLQTDQETQPQEPTKKRNAELRTKCKSVEHDTPMPPASTAPSISNSPVGLFHLNNAGNVPFNSPKPKTKKRKKTSMVNVPTKPKRSTVSENATSEGFDSTSKILLDESSSMGTNTSERKRNRTGLEDGPRAAAASKAARSEGDVSAAILLTTLAGNQSFRPVQAMPAPAIAVPKLVAIPKEKKSVVLVTPKVPSATTGMAKTTSKTKLTVVPQQKQKQIKQAITDVNSVRPKATVKSASKSRTSGVMQPQQTASSPSREVVLNEKINEQYKQLRAFLKNFTDQSMKLIHSRNLRGPVPSALDNRRHLDSYSKLLEEHRAAHNYLQSRLLRSAESTLWLLKESKISSEEARSELKECIKKFGKILYDTLHRQELERLAFVSKHPNTTIKFKKNRRQTPSSSSTTTDQSNYPCKAAFEKVEDICAAIARPVGRPRSGLAPLRG